MVSWAKGVRLHWNGRKLQNLKVQIIYTFYFNSASAYLAYWEVFWVNFFIMVSKPSFDITELISALWVVIRLTPSAIISKIINKISKRFQKV